MGEFTGAYAGGPALTRGGKTLEKTSTGKPEVRVSALEQRRHDTNNPDSAMIACISPVIYLKGLPVGGVERSCTRDFTTSCRQLEAQPKKNHTTHLVDNMTTSKQSKEVDNQSFGRIRRLYVWTYTAGGTAC